MAPRRIASRLLARRMARLSAATLLTVGLAACGGAPDPGPARAPAGEATAAPAAPTATGPTARIEEVKGTPGDTMKVVVIFENPTAAPCAIPTYTLRWPGGTKKIDLGDFVIPPGESRQRSVKAHPDDGDITLLDATSARIELPPRCAP